MARNLYRLAVVIYIGFVLWVTLRPLPGPNAPTALVPIVDTWRQMRDNGGASAALEVVGNLLLFVPLGFFLAAAFRSMRKLYVVALVAGLFSAAIEASQTFFVDRSTSVDDFILNTIGATIGSALCLLIRARRKHRHPSRDPAATRERV